MSPGKRRDIIEPDHPKLGLSAQCRVLNISRSTLYYKPLPASEETLSLMKAIDKLFTKYPFFSSRQVVAWLAQAASSSSCLPLPLEGDGDHATQSGPVRGHYLHTRQPRVSLPRCLYGWATRKVLSWRAYADFCVDALQEAIERYGPTEIMNTDQCSQFTGSEWITALTDARVRISMDGRGRYLDNIFIERLWRSLKYEAVYLQDIADGFVAQRVIDEWMNFYNRQRPHSALGKATPDEAYGETNELKKAA